MSITSDFWKAMNESGTKVSGGSTSGGSSQKSSGGSSQSDSGGSSGGSYIAPTSTKKKKKKSISEEFWEAMGDDDIAPVSSVASRVQARTSGGRFNADLAPVVKSTGSKKGKDERKWYEKGHFEDGYQIGDIAKTILGVKDDTASLKDLTVGSLKRGYYNARYGEESFRAMNGEQNQKEAYEKILADEDYQFTPGNGAAGAVSGAMELLGQQARQFTNPRTLAFTGTAAGAAFVAGQAGPQVLVPEEIISVPAAATAAFTAASATSNLEIEAGHAYNEMIEAGISEETAKKVAWGVGAANAGLELLQVDELLDAYKVTKASGATKTVTKKIFDELVDRGVDVSKETVQEVAQEGVTIAGTQYASKKDKGEKAYTADEVKDLLKDTAKSSALSFGLMNVPAAAKNTASIVSEQHKANSLTANEQKVVDKVVADRIAEKEKDGTKLSGSEKKKITESVVSDMERGYLSIGDIESALGGQTYEDYKRISEWEDGLQKEYDELHAMKRGEMTGEQIDREAHLKEQLKNVKATSRRDALKSKLSEDVFGLVKGDRLIESYNERTRRGQVFEADLTKYDAKQQATIQKAIDSGILNNTNRTHEFVDIISKISADKGVLFDFTNNTKLKESGFAVEGRQVNGFVTKDGISINIDSPKAWQSTVGHEITHVLEGTEIYSQLQNTLFEYAKTKGEYDSRYQTLTELYKDVKDADINAELTADLVGEYLFTDEDFIKNLSTNHRNVFQKIYDEIKYLVKVATGSKEARELERVKRAFDKAYKEAGAGLSDTKYSISSEGKQLTKEQQEYFKDSKMRDENGNLKVMYHGSTDAGFHVFDPDFSDDGTSLFFVDRNNVAASYSGSDEVYEAKSINTVEDLEKFFAEIGAEGYEVVEENGRLALYHDGDHVVETDDARGIYEEFCDYAGVGEGEANYKVYLNLKNPLEVDAQGSSWNNVSREYSQEVADKYHSLTAAEKAALTDAAEWGEISIFRDAKNNPPDAVTESAFAKMGDVNIYDLFTIAEDNFSEETIKQFAVKQMNTRDYAQKAKAEGYDGVIFKNLEDIGGYGVRGETVATVAIAFDSNQIKSVANGKPTADPDIRYSLSADSEGRELSPATAKRFGKSKVVDENGKLKAVYHGTATGEFSIFDKSKGSVEGDFGSGFYFTDNESDVSEHYEGGGPDFENKVARLAEQIEADEDIDYEEAEERARAELYKGSHKFEVYLNVENPAIVGETILFDGESYLEQYNEDDYEDYDEYIADVEQLLADDIENIVWEVERKVDIDSADGLADILYEAYYNGGIGIEELKAKINELYLEDSNGNLACNEVARQVIESLGYDGIIDPTVSGKWNMDIEDGTTHYIVFKPNQIKAVTNQNPTDNPDIHRSLSKIGEAPGKTGRFATPATELRLTTEDSKDVAPIAENATVQEKTQLTGENSTVTAADMQELFPNNAVPEQEELEQLVTERDQLYSALEIAVDRGSAAEVGKLAEEYEALNSRIKALESKEAERTGSLDDADAPPEMDAPFYGESSEQPVPDDPFYERDISDVGKRSVKAYQYENPEVKPFFQEAALGMLYDVANTTKGEKWYNDELYYATGGEKGFGGTKRSTTPDIAELKDVWGYTYDQIEKGLNAIIEDDGKENNAVSKRIEFMLNDRLLKGYADIDGRPYEPNQDYIRLLNEKQITEYSKEAFDSFMQNADMYAPMDDVAPTKPLEKATPDTMDAPVFESKDKNAVKGQTTMFEPEKPKVNPRVARVLTEESHPREKTEIGMKAVSAFVDKGMVFENLSLDSGNHEVQAKWNSALPANTEKKAQYFMEKGAEGVKPLKEIIKDVKKTGKEEAFSDYMYHVHNIDRMSLEDRFGLENKAVFGDTVTAEVSTKKVQQYEKANPEFKAIAESVYEYNKYLRGLLVENGVISQETADLWEKEYPHYVPVRRVDQKGKNISVPLDTNKTGVNAPVKRATGGSSDIEPLFNTMAMRTEQVFSAIARNRFGIELKNTLDSTINTQKNATGVDEAINLIEDQESNLLKPGTLNSNPTFTVFENGERVEFEITEDMYDALKPAGKLLGHRNDKITKASEWRRNMLTTWNPVFALWRNPVKDLQDVMINSQHAAKTYAQLVTPTKDNVFYQIAKHGKWAAEYESNGGKGSTYFDSKKKEFTPEDNILKKTIGFPVRVIEWAGEFIEEIPRLAEYIASRKEGRSVDRSMLDAARVTTNFAAGGDVTRFANAHGFTFLNASVQGASQHVRNFREATRQDGMKGFVKTLAKYTLAGIPGIILNNMVWGDDEEYEELSDYVKQNYYVVWKTQDGKFFRIPKGRTAAVMNNALEQMQHLVTGDDEADFSTFFELFMNNIAPNNPIDNNILAPIGQALNNKAWYGDDLVPTRLQDLPAEEQFDESTDALSKIIGEKTGTSPYKWNYLIDQYSGGLGDMLLPMATPEAESGDNSFVGNLLAPWKKEMTTDSVLNNKNPGNFYDLKDELEVVANGKNATEEDKMRSMYLDSVSWEMGDLYAQKREIQSSDLPDDQKYAKVREIQEQINELANNALDKYNNVRINGAYSEAGDRRYNYDADKDKWYEIKPTNSDGSDNWYYIQEQLSHDKLGMSYDDFWNGKQPPEGGTYYAEYNGKRYNYDAGKNQWYEIRAKNDDGSDNWYYQKEQEVTKGLGISYEEYWSKPKEYNFAYDKPGQYAISQAVGGYDSYMEHYDALHDWQSDNYIGSDKDSKGNSISGSRKKKVSKYIDGLDLDYGEKLILYRSVYSGKADKRAYNQDIIDYLNERDDIDYQEMKSILEELDFKVDSEGYISW